jgi:hypothetical protein
LENFGQFCAESFSQIREETFMAIGVKGKRAGETPPARIFVTGARQTTTPWRRDY